MFNNVALDVFIGLVFIFLLYSLLATIIQELIATRFAFRAKVLEKAILRMLEDGRTTTWLPYWDRIMGFIHIFGLKNLLRGKTVAPWFYSHPLIKYLAEDNYYSKPAYLSARNFSKVMIDLLKGFGQPDSNTVQSIHNSITNGTIYKLPVNIGVTAADPVNPAIKVLREQNPNVINNVLLQYETVAINSNTSLFLKSLWQESGADIDVFRLKLEQWFDDTMERATGWYKRYTRVILFFVGLLIAYVFNVDTIAIHRVLSKDKTAREQLVQMAISNKDKYAKETDRINKGDSTIADSLLKNTYRMVAKDAELSNNILGLGKPWKDTCSICKDSIYAGRKIASQNLILLEKNNVSVLESNLKIYYTIRNTLLAKANGGNPQVKRELIKLDSIIASANGRLNERLERIKRYERLSILKDRCKYIKETIGTKWNFYSPNQSGGMETFLGWLITALAITLGAPFWFDLLSRLIKIRGTGSKIVSPDTVINSAGQASSPATNPVTVNVNPDPGEEAVG